MSQHEDPILSKAKGNRNIDLILQDKPNEYPDGLYLYDFLNNTIDKISAKQMKDIFKEVLLKLKEFKKKKLYFHPANDKIRKVVEKLGAIVEDNHSPHTKILDGEIVLIPAMSITIEKLEKALF